MFLANCTWKNRHYLSLSLIMIFGVHMDRKSREKRDNIKHNKFNVHWSVHGNNILIYIEQDAKLHSLFYLETALMFREVPPIIRSANNCIYSIWYLSHRYCYLSLSWKSWNWFECAVGGVYHPQHNKTGSNSSTITTGSSNGVANIRCCRYSCLRTWWWVVVPPDTCTAVSR